MGCGINCMSMKSNIFSCQSKRMSKSRCNLKLLNNLRDYTYLHQNLRMEAFGISYLGLVIRRKRLHFISWRPLNVLMRQSCCKLHNEKLVLANKDSKQSTYKISELHQDECSSLQLTFKHKVEGQ